MGRAPAFWTEENASLIKDKFVAVSVSNYDQGRKDAVGQFFKDAKMQPSEVDEVASMNRTVTVLRDSRAGSRDTPIALPHE